MQVRLTVNLGRADAIRLGLDAPCEGSTLEVGAEAARELLRRGWAEARAVGPPGAGEPAPEDEVAAGARARRSTRRRRGR